MVAGVRHRMQLGNRGAAYCRLLGLLYWKGDGIRKT